jgi:uncharacterized protein (TIGR02246 family)
MPKMTPKATIRVVLVAGAVMFSSAGCAHTALRPAPDARAATEAIFAKYAASLGAGNADEWATLWMEDGVQMPPDAPAVVGRSQIREKLRSLLAQFRFDMQIHTEEVRTAGDWAFARGKYEATLSPKAGGPPIPIDGKFMTILARQSDGTWRIYRDIFNSNVPPAAR